MSLEDIAKDDELNRFAVAGGRSAFLVNCVQCHGSGAAGSPGYPNLNDDDWLWGGTLDDIHTTITHGIRYDAGSRHAHLGDAGLRRRRDAERRGDQGDGELRAVALRRGRTTRRSPRRASRSSPTIAPPATATTAAAAASSARRALNDAIWLYGGTLADDHRADHQAAARRHAGLGAAARSDHDQGAGALRPFARRRRGGDGRPRRAERSWRRNSRASGQPPAPATAPRSVRVTSASGVEQRLLPATSPPRARIAAAGDAAARRRRRGRGRRASRTPARRGPGGTRSRPAADEIEDALSADDGYLAALGQNARSAPRRAAPRPG